MTRRGVHRWAARAFCPGTKVNVHRSPTGRCCVELWLPTPHGRESYEVVRWVESESWGDCVRAIEEHFMFTEAARPEWNFRSQILVHERKDEVALRVLGGARVTSPAQPGASAWQSLLEIGRYPVT